MRRTQLIVEIKSEMIDDYRESFEVVINGESVFEVFDGEPEDNTLSRNFNDIYKLQSIIEKVYQAGKNQEPLTFKED